jgi:S-adenosylmethionine/arginine decarboxylase-like enzyme
MLKHEHLIIRADVKKPPTNVAEIEVWIQNLVSAINMKILRGPFAVYSDVEGNRGLTAVCIIETSHIALHVWDEDDPSMLQLDVYSCAEVNIETVLDFIEEFEPIHTDYKFLNREDKFITVG